MQLHKILSAAGYMLGLTGMAAMDSDLILIPIAMIITGSCLLIWSAYEDGYFRKRGGKRK